jgi:hypothetical protein
MNTRASWSKYKGQGGCINHALAMGSRRRSLQGWDEPASFPTGVKEIMTSFAPAAGISPEMDPAIVDAWQAEHARQRVHQQRRRLWSGRLR